MAYTIDEFCTAHRISKATLYGLREQGRGPDVIRTGDRGLIISREAAQQWRLSLGAAWEVSTDDSDRSRQNARGLSDAHAS